ncbi:hypothetical protein Vretimale_11807 [Volvox reticuliferus]|uniref:Coenzyme Q-binding protein COQ10 START domain-containing protein n=1 Tax=Volvox reticuliferus TaxID=1737510 RepID=A0A8J4CG53_9CHLO|nr:hypothetical protein Vretifemale_11270 [Volvox reticuliferus]GIM07756.1 hypothetical protein Vretimale_11807 [Volvox reticuliferus]
MRSHLANIGGHRPLDCRTAQQTTCSCSSLTQSLKSAPHVRPRHSIAACEQGVGRRPSSACGACSHVAASSLKLQAATRHCRQRRGSLGCFAATEPGPGPDSVISGYTPANYISFSENEKDVATHNLVIDVDAPANICFGIWNDWNRLVEFLDLVAQIGLDVNNPDLALFQCFYRHGLLPVMEIVFVLQKTEILPDKRIAFESVWGMPMSGSVTFKSLRDGKTRVKLSFSQALPDLLVDLKVGVFGVQNSLMPILSENLQAFRSIAEAAAHDPSSLAPRVEAGERAYALFDEEADIAMFEEILENLEFEDEEEAEALQGEEEVLVGSGAAGLAGSSAPSPSSSAGEQGLEEESLGSVAASTSAEDRQGVVSPAVRGPAAGYSSRRIAGGVAGAAASSSGNAEREEYNEAGLSSAAAGVRRSAVAPKKLALDSAARSSDAAAASPPGPGVVVTRKRATRSRGVR